MVFGYPRFDSFLEYGLVRVLGEFLAGCWLYGIYRSGICHRKIVRWLGLAALAGIFLFPTMLPRLPVIFTIFMFVILVISLSLNEGPLRIVFGNRAMVYLGEISYSVYMLHWFILNNLDNFGFMSMPLQIRIWAVLATILITSAITYHLVENTSRRYLRHSIKYKWSMQPAI